MTANLENSAVATGLEKVSFHSNPKKYSNYHTIELISHASKVMLKILQTRFQQYVNRELKLGKEYIKAVHQGLLIYLICRVHHEKRWAGGSTSCNQVCQEKYQ